MNSLLNTLMLAVAFLALFASAELMYHKFRIKAEITRKYVHIVTGLITMLFPFLIGDHWLVLLLCGSFLLLLAVSLYFRFLPSINAVDRITRGSILYPVVVYGCYLAYDYYGNLLFFYLPVLILAVCDPIAALTGKKWPFGKYRTWGGFKTISGSSGFFVSSLIVSVTFIRAFSGLSLSAAFPISLSIALVTTGAEAFVHRGYDNLSIPAGALLTLIYFRDLVIQNG